MLLLLLFTCLARHHNVSSPHPKKKKRTVQACAISHQTNDHTGCRGKPYTGSSSSCKSTVKGMSIYLTYPGYSLLASTKMKCKAVRLSHVCPGSPCEMYGSVIAVVSTFSHRNYREVKAGRSDTSGWFVVLEKDNDFTRNKTPCV